MTYTIYLGINDIDYNQLSEEELNHLTDSDVGYDPRWERISLYQMIEDEFILNRIEKERIKSGDPIDLHSLLWELTDIRRQSEWCIEHGRSSMR